MSEQPEQRGVWCHGAARWRGWQSPPHGEPTSQPGPVRGLDAGPRSRTVLERVTASPRHLSEAGPSLSSQPSAHTQALPAGSGPTAGPLEPGWSRVISE